MKSRERAKEAIPRLEMGLGSAGRPRPKKNDELSRVMEMGALDKDLSQESLSSVKLCNSATLLTKASFLKGSELAFAPSSSHLKTPQITAEPPLLCQMACFLSQIGRFGAQSTD
ncbi:hypothetical protein CRG98_011582 [Punica granatum]|uniref:Uncharacterized protein n=1 Tax=Punica granatum TaxID=22663 RepID=A0A2I0KJM0_PUNGR|nr:hypothetical protein CRG98_011582 [Punica granatum]